MSKDPYPHRERLDNPAGDEVIVPKEFYRLRDRRRSIDKYDHMWDRIAPAQRASVRGTVKALRDEAKRKFKP